MSRSKFTVFFSWQSDTKGNYKIIKDAILAECQKQRENHGYDVEIDEATRNLPGSPKIEDAILEKIERADVFVCDITPIATCAPKQLPNSNVLFELGYAFRALGAERIIMLAKKGSWDLKDMPFDFNHRRIGTFSSGKDLDLQYEIDSCIQFCSKKSAQRKDWNAFSRWFKSVYGKKMAFKIELRKKRLQPQCLKATEESTVLFARRMAAAFPGERDVVEFTNRQEIIKRLSILLQGPLQFEQGLKDADTDPIWLFRAGATEHVDSFVKINRKKVLLNCEELLIKRLVVFRDNGRYYGQYVYVETEPDKPSGCYPLNMDDINEIRTLNGCYSEEFAVFKLSPFTRERLITRQEYDDGAFMSNNRHIYLNGRAQLRVRYLTPYNFIIAAKFSPFNCPNFDRTSGAYFKGMLNHSISNEQFNSYMSGFPKKETH